VVRYNRLAPLCVETAALEGLECVRGGDCVVAFSRRELYRIKAEIELRSAGALQCAVVYGSLPPSARREQAARFNGSGRGGADVLVATDAIGMGLNLNIDRVVFSALQKFDGTCKRKLVPAELRQIAGRAGRFGRAGKAGKDGLVTCFEQGEVRRGACARVTGAVTAGRS
jgi:ATP-dependent RNA helicase SUPV3L1/SUV3